MSGNAAVSEQKVATGTWNLPGPINSFSYATYTTRDGKSFNLPVSVAGEKITGQLPGTAQSR